MEREIKDAARDFTRALREACAAAQAMAKAAGAAMLGPLASGQGLAAGRAGDMAIAFEPASGAGGEEQSKRQSAALMAAGAGAARDRAARLTGALAAEGARRAGTPSGSGQSDGRAGPQKGGGFIFIPAAGQATVAGLAGAGMGVLGFPMTLAEEKEGFFAGGIERKTANDDGTLRPPAGGAEEGGRSMAGPEVSRQIERFGGDWAKGRFDLGGTGGSLTPAQVSRIGEALGQELHQRLAAGFPMYAR